MKNYNYIYYTDGQMLNGVKFVEEIESRITKWGETRRATFECSCGELFSTDIQNVKCGHTSSCGCKREQISRITNLKHGLTKHPLFHIWANMKQRTTNKLKQGYKSYGGRGISVCSEWFNDFKLFYNWCMVNGYKDGLEIDRIDNDGNYEPNNCRWVTKAENLRNTRSNKLDWVKVNEIRAIGKSKTQMELAEIYNVHFTTIGYVLNNKLWRV